MEKFYLSLPKELVALLKDKKLRTLEETCKLADEIDSYRDKVFSNQGNVHIAREQRQNCTQDVRSSGTDSLQATSGVARIFRPLCKIGQIALPHRPTPGREKI